MFHTITQVLEGLDQTKNRPNCQDNAGKEDPKFRKLLPFLCHNDNTWRKVLCLFLQILMKVRHYMLAPMCSCCKRFFNSNSRASAVVRGRGMRIICSE